MTGRAKEPAYRDGKPNPLQQEVLDRINEVEALFRSACTKYCVNRAKLDAAGMENHEDLFGFFLMSFMRNLRDKQAWPCALSTYVYKYLWYCLGYAWRDEQVRRGRGGVNFTDCRWSFRSGDDKQFHNSDCLTTREPDLALGMLWPEIRRHLRPRERDVLEQLYGLADRPALTYKELAALEGVSKQRIQQLEKAGLRRLRKNLRQLGEVA